MIFYSFLLLLFAFKNSASLDLNALSNRGNLPSPVSPTVGPSKKTYTVVDSGLSLTNVTTKQNLSVHKVNTDTLDARQNASVLSDGNITRSDQVNHDFKLKSKPWFSDINNGALKRTCFVVGGLVTIVALYLAVKVIRIQRKSKTRKYGIITSTDLEMEPLGKGEEDEEDTTLFDARNHKYGAKN